jgi:hypothetical protein
VARWRGALLFLITSLDVRPGVCAGIMTQKFGRPFYLSDPDEFRKLEEAGGHTDPQKCVAVVGQAASWVMEILLDKGAIEL